MQQHDDDSEQLGVDMNRMLRALPRERLPDPALEDRIAQQLSRRRLLVGGAQHTRVKRQGGAVAITWPTAAAAALLLFVSGVVVGALSGRSNVPVNPGVSDANSVAANTTARSTGDLLLASDKSGSVKRVIKF